MSDGVVRIELRGTLQAVAGEDRVFGGATGEIVQSFEVCVVRFQALRAKSISGLGPVVEETQLKRIGNARGNLVLNGKHALLCAFIRPRPKMRIGGHVDQLRSDANLIVRLADASLEHVVDLERIANVLNVELLALEGERRRSRRHP